MITVIAIGCAVFVIGLFAGMIMGLAEDPPGLHEPKAAQICFAAAIAGAVVAFAAAVIEISLRMLCA